MSPVPTGLREGDEVKPETCDGCRKPRRNIQSVGRDDNGDPDAPDLCFVCRKEGERGRLFDRETGRYEALSLQEEFG